jgi:hypothetical protein
MDNCPGCDKEIDWAFSGNWFYHLDTNGLMEIGGYSFSPCPTGQLVEISGLYGKFKITPEDLEIAKFKITS